jgi:carbon-monoxide dehydrogenase small subunit
MVTVISANQRVNIKLKVNGQLYSVAVEPARMLAQVIRDDLGLMGTKVACGMANCGACTVLRNGVPIYSCITLALDCDGSEVTTIEGLAGAWTRDSNHLFQRGEPENPSAGLEGLHPLQRAFVEEDSYQCGFCTSGQILTLSAFLEQHRDPTEDEIRHAVAGNLCRCGAYLKIVRAGMKAAEMMREEADRGSRH